MRFGFRRKRERPELITVTMLESASGRPLDELGLSAEQIGEAIREQLAAVPAGSDQPPSGKAGPGHRAGRADDGRLSLVVDKTEMADPFSVRFSLPTIEASLPPMRGPDASPAYRIHEDDWRQCEFVSRQFGRDLESELAEIRRVWAEKDGPGFERCHLRSRVGEPLRGVELRLAEVSDALGGVEPVGLDVGGGRVVDGFALPLPGGAAYGRLAGGSIQALGLHGTARPLSLRAMADEHGLALVDWLRASAG
jgi:hypothetical protein